MDKELRRVGALIAAVILVAAACSSSTTSPSASVAAPAASESAAPAGSEGAASGEPTPGITAIRRHRLGRQAGRRRDPLVLLPRHRRRAGAGRGRGARSPRRSTPRTRASTCRFEGYPYQPARDALSIEIASGNGPDIVGPVGIGGAEAFHGQWLDLAAAHRQERLRHDPVPGARPSTSTTSAARARSASRSRSIRRSCSTRPSLFKEAGLDEPPHE